MSDTKETDDKTAKSGGRKSLSLKRPIDSGTLKQSLSHGRSRSVVVEKRRKRTLTAKGEGAEAKAGQAEPAKPAKPATPVETKPAAPAVEVKKPPRQAPSGRGRPPARGGEGRPPRREKSGDKSGNVLRTLTDQEKVARAKALELAKVNEAKRRKQAAEDAARLAKEEAERKILEEKEAKEAALREAEEEARRKEEEERAQKQAAAAPPPVSEKPARRKEAAAAPAPAPEAGKAVPRGKEAPRKPDADDEMAGGRIKRKRAAQPPAPSNKRNEPRRRTGKLTITNALEEGERTRSLAAMRRQREREKRLMRGETARPEKVVRDVTIPETITIRDLADRMATRAAEVIKVMMKQGTIVTVNDTIDADTAQLVAEEFGHSVKRVADSDVEEGLYGDSDVAGDLVDRPPVVTIMGHVDHGKTSLLDALRATDVVSGEAGGITQHIGAYQVQLANGQRISFLDTPGHAAFTSMRARGAKVTDLVVLVVAGDDGVMPQTIEAISHSKAAEVPMIVAVNKMDKPEADGSRVKQELLQHEVIVEDMGGEVQAVEVSALKRLGLDTLEEAILLQAELLELKANPDRPATGTVVEAKLDKGRGPVATVLVQNGTLKVGDIFVSGQTWGRVRALINDKGQQVDEAGPSLPVEVLGLNGTPLAGDDMAVVENEARAREIAEYRERKAKDVKTAAETQKRGTLQQMLQQLKDTDAKEYPVVIKGDVQGSVEAIVGALENLSTDEVSCKAIHSAVGGITASDVVLAQASGAPIIGFNVRANTQAREQAARDGIEIRYYSVIYDLVDDVKAAMSGLLDPTLREHFLGNAEILEVFNISKVGKVAGCQVTEGVVRRGSKVRLIRDNVVIHEGTLSTLKRFKDEVKEVQNGQECGMAFENYQDIQKGDVIECFDVETIERSL